MKARKRVHGWESSRVKKSMLTTSAISGKEWGHLDTLYASQSLKTC